MGSIVRSKEGCVAAVIQFIIKAHSLCRKMVNVSARTPFTLQSAGGSTSAPPFSSSPPTPTPQAPGDTVGRRPPVLTMTPARARLHADSRYSSPTGSRSSSRRRTGTDPTERDRYTSYFPPSERGKQATPSEWFGDTESESSHSHAGDAGPEEVRLSLQARGRVMRCNFLTIDFPCSSNRLRG
jgi:hypothetical protein